MVPRSRRKDQHITARSIVRPVKRLNRKSIPDGQGELFAHYRRHGVFSDSPLTMLQAETDHLTATRSSSRSSSTSRPMPLLLTTLGVISAVNSAWLVVAAIAFNLTRAAGTIAGS